VRGTSGRQAFASSGAILYLPEPLQHGVVDLPQMFSRITPAVPALIRVSDHELGVGSLPDHIDVPGEDLLDPRVIEDAF
jgi:hypothetical protein